MQLKNQLAYLALAVLLGIVTLLISKVQFVIPGAEIGFTDLREVIILASVIFMPRWYYAVIIGVIGSLVVPEGGSMATTIAIHVIAAPSA